MFGSAVGPSVWVAGRTVAVDGDAVGPLHPTSRQINKTIGIRVLRCKAIVYKTHLVVGQRPVQIY